MAISSYNRIKIIQYVNDGQLGCLSYPMMLRQLGKGKKPTDEEFLEFFTDQSIENFKKDTIYNKTVAKYISCVLFFLARLLKASKEVDSHLIDKIRCINDYYKEYLEKNNLDKDETIEEYLNDLNTILDNKFKSSNSDTSIKEYLEEIKKLKKEINDLNDTITIHLATIKSLEKKEATKDNSLIKAQEKANKLNGENIVLNKKIKELEKEIKRLEKQIRELLSKIEVLEKDKEESNNDINSVREELNNALSRINELNTLYNDALSKLEEKDKIIDGYKTREDEKKELIFKVEQGKEKDKLIDEKILMFIAEGSKSINELITYLQRFGYDLSKNEIREHLNNIRTRFNIDSTNFIEEVKYGIKEPGVSTNGIFDINIGDKNNFEFILTSDWHLDDKLDESIIKEIRLLHDYCLNRGINFIVDGGDLFFKNCNRIKDNYSSLINSDYIVRNAISMIPYNEGIYHAVLGGNHDRDILRCGVDPIKRICDEREDFINLGYDHSRICFNGSRSILSSLGLHHFNMRFKEPTDDRGYNTIDIRKNLETYYSERGLDGSYIDLLGHIHRSSLNVDDGICIIPSYFKDRVSNGFFRVKVFFDDERNIKQMIFVPVIKNYSKLIEVTEIPYVKKLSK